MAIYHWLNSAGGSWDVASNWDLGSVPTAADTAIIDAAGTYLVTIAGTDVASSLTLNAAGATVVDSGALTLTGALLVSAGTFNLAATGTVNGGTLSAAGGSFAWNGGTLSGATYQGTLDLTAAGASLSVANGLTATGTGGVGAGVINATGGATSLTFLGTQTIDNVTINDGSAAGGASAIDFGNLTLGAHATINQLGGGATSSLAVDLGTSLTNNGTIQTSQANAGADIVVTTLTNNGFIGSSNPYGGFTLQAADFTNNGTLQTLGGGIGITATNSFTNNGLIVDTGGIAVGVTGFANNGIITLGGYNTYLAIVGSTTAVPASGLSGTGTINMAGSLDQLRLLGSESLQSGTINLSGTNAMITSGALLAGVTNQLVLGARMVINHTAGTTQLGGWDDTLNGTINASGAGGTLTINPQLLIDNGSINVSGGDHVLLTGQVTGTGQFTLASGGIVEFGSLVSSTNSVAFTDTSNATLRLDLGDAANVKSTIQGFTTGNTIDLTGIAAAGATWANNVLTVNGSGWGMTGPITLAMVGNYAGAVFHIAADGILAAPPGFGFGIYPGSNITVTGVGTPAPARVYGGTGTTLSAAEGSAVTAPLASFTDSTVTDTASQLSATITWGDGTTSAGIITGANGTFSVAAAGHAYADEGSYATSIAVTNSADSVTTTLTGAVTATEADVLTAGAAPAIAATTSTAFSGTVATFTDTYTANTAADFAATINWGDGTSSAGTITDANGAISVAGSHIYTQVATDSISVTLADTHGTATATAAASAAIASPLAGTGAALTTAEGSAAAGTVATFTDANLADAASAFTATIAWGDGTTSTGVVTGANGAFSVAAGHAYADEGTTTTSIAVTDTATGFATTLTGSATATEADVLTPGAAIALTATAGVALSGTVATFTDTYTASTAADFAATIIWGDGITTTGTVSETAGVISVAGSHSYTAAGTNTMSVALTDIHGTATATATGTAIVAAPPGGTYVLTTHQDDLVGAAGNDLFLATSNTLSDGDVIIGGSGTNTLKLVGGGVFDLSIPDRLAVQIVTAQDGAGAAAQLVTLREGSSYAVNVVSDPSGNPAAGITIIGADNTDVITLGNGHDTITLGVGETVIGGGGVAVYKVNGDTIGDTITGGATGSNTLVVAGGDIAMGANITGMTAVQLAGKTSFTANTTAGMTITGSAAGGDTIRLGASNQSVIGGGANEKVLATSANAGASVSGLGANATLEITTGGTVALAANTAVTTVKLDAATHLTLSRMSFITAIGGSGADTITAGATYQTLTGGGGGDTLAGFAGGYDVFKDKGAGLSGATIQTFVASDQIDVTNFAFAGATLKAVASGANTLVTLASGSSRTSFTMAGSFSASGFHLASDGSLGTLITHS